MLKRRVGIGLLTMIALVAAAPCVDSVPQFGHSGPSITSVSPIAVQANQTITITGSGFGSHPSYSSQDTPYLAIRDKTAGWAAGRVTRSNVDAVTLSVAGWTDSRIVVAGFGGAYGGRWQVNNGDQVEVAVWNAQTGAGPATYDLTVGGAPPAPELGPNNASGVPATTVTVPGNQPWTATGVNLVPGEEVSVHASSGVSLGPGGTPDGPDGEPPSCLVVANGPYGWRSRPYLANELPCGSLVGRIGQTGKVFEVGGRATFRATSGGELYLGVNDNFFPDNSGSWTASIQVSSAAAAQALSSPPATGRQAGPQATAPLRAAKLTILHSFSDAPSGLGPLIQGRDGNLYGVFGFEYPANQGRDLSPGCQVFGGSCGIVYRLDPQGNLTVLHSFSLRADGGFPRGALVEGTDENFYGATISGGMTKCPLDSTGCGTIFRIDTSGNLKVLHAFSGRDGAAPDGSLLQAMAGQFYGAATSGGASSTCQGGCGVIFKIDSTGNFTLLHSFAGADGANPSPGLVQAGDGNFYGAAAAGGAHNKGVVFRMNASGSVTVLHSFSGPDGAVPNGGLVQSPDGYLYGTTSSGGSSGQGTVFRISTSGGFTLLHSLSGTDGSSPMAALLRATDGGFYGTTMGQGGNNCAGSSCGSVFSIDSAGSFRVVYAFTAADGGFPETGLIESKDGSFCGTTSQGGSDGAGSVFRLTASSGQRGQAEDATIISDIEDKLWQDSTLKSQDIRVSSQNGTVTLEGAVATAADKKRVEQIAQSEKGVKLIIDRLAVAETAGSGPR